MIIEGLYSPKDLTDILDIGDSSLRKWCIAIEEQGYFFSRTENNKRMFLDRDLIVLKHFKQLVKVQNMSLQNAAVVVASKYQDIRSTAGAQEDSIDGQRALEETLESFQNNVLSEIEQLKDLNRQLLTRLDEQQKYIEERLTHRDNMLLESIRETQTTKQLLLEVREEQQKKTRRGLLNWFRRDS